jgi:hypothetical protein
MIWPAWVGLAGICNIASTHPPFSMSLFLARTGSDGQPSFNREICRVDRTRPRAEEVTVVVGFGRAVVDLGGLVMKAKDTTHDEQAPLPNS